MLPKAGWFSLVGAFIFHRSANREIGVFIYTCGSGYIPALRSFLTSLVPRDEMALLFTMIGVFESVGALVGSPLLALAFSTGIRKGGVMTGLPFFCAAIIYGGECAEHLVVEGAGDILSAA